MIKKGFSHIGIFFLYVLALLPMAVLYGLSSIMYYFTYYLIGYRRTVVRENLLNAFPEKPLNEIIEIEKRFYHYLCDLVVEIIKMPTLSESELEKRYLFKNLEMVTDPLNRGESLILCSAHYGNWEWGMMALGLKFDNPKYVIFKPLNNESFDEWFYKARSKFGNAPIPMKQTLRTVIRSKDETSVLCFASDQTPVRTPSDYWLQFLHQPTVVFSGPEKIAMQTNRQVIYIKVNYLRRGIYEAECVSVAPIPLETAEHDITKAQFEILENHIHANPAYWLWSHRRWKHKPETPTDES